MNKSEKRLDYLDYAKGIGIFLVVLGHCLSRQNISSNFALILRRYIYAFHMPLFFIISGIGVYYKLSKLDSIDMKAEAKRLTERILLPYLFWSAVYICLETVKSILQGGMNWHSILLSGYATVIGRGMAPLWFLHSLFMAELVFFCFWRMLNNRKLSYSHYLPWGEILVFSAVISVAGDTIFRTLSAEDLNPLINYPLVSLFRFFPALFFLIAGFLLGIILTKYDTIVQKSAFLCIGMVFAGAVFWTVEHFSKNQLSMHRYKFDNIWVFLITGFFGSLMLIFFCMLLPHNIRLLQETGRNSLHIMVLHYPPIPILQLCIKVLASYSNPLVWLIETTAAMAICYMIILLILNPLHKRITSLFRKVKKTA